MVRKKIRPRGGASYPCPHCDSVSHVVLTRRRDGRVFRRRQCLECEEVFDTMEELLYEVADE